MVQLTAILLIGANIDTCQKLKTIIGSVNINADRVNVKAVLISKKFGKKKNKFSKYFCI
jgi:hypothetical protein